MQTHLGLDDEPVLNGWLGDSAWLLGGSIPAFRFRDVFVVVVCMESGESFIFPGLLWRS